MIGNPETACTRKIHSILCCPLSLSLSLATHKNTVPTVGMLALQRRNRHVLACISTAGGVGGGIVRTSRKNLACVGILLRAPAAQNLYEMSVIWTSGSQLLLSIGHRGSEKSLLSNTQSHKNISDTKCCFGAGISVCATARLWPGWPRSRGSIPDRGKSFFTSP
jgi:hypothetical protein